MVFIPSLPAAQDCDLIYSRNHTHRNEWNVWGLKWRLTSQNRRTLKSAYLPHPLDLNITGGAGEWVILNSVPKVKAAFLTMGKACVLEGELQSNCFMGEASRAGPQLTSFCFTTEGRRAQHQPSSFRPLSTQILKEKQGWDTCFELVDAGRVPARLESFLPIHWRH